MNQNEKIYFIISGVRDGFKRSHLLCNNNITEVIDYIDDRRQIANSASSFFYSIEKTTNYTLATLFNPNTNDQVGRKAYIAITLFIKNGYTIQGNLIGTLNGLMNYYLLKQGNENSNRFTEEMFEAEYANLSIVPATNTLSTQRKNCGYFNYDNTIEINTFFENLTITGFQKVYFLDASNSGVINQLISFEKITQFPVSMVYQISDFKYGKYEVLLNGGPYRIQSNTSIINIVGFQGDLVTIKNIFTGKKVTFTITTGNQSKSIFVYFPEDKPQPPSQSQHPHGINNSYSTNTNGRGSYEKQKNPSTYLIAAIVVLSIVMLSIIGYLIWEKYYEPGGGETATDTTQTTKGGATNSPTTTSPTGGATNSPTTTSPTGGATNNNTQATSSNTLNQPVRSSSSQTVTTPTNLPMRLEENSKYLKNCNFCKKFKKEYSDINNKKTKQNCYNRWITHTQNKNEHKISN